MRLLGTLLITAALLFNISTLRAKSKGEELQRQAATALEKKEYTQARYLYLQAYSALAEEKAYDAAAACGAKVGALYHRENMFKEAFEVLRNADQYLSQEEREGSKQLPAAHYPLTKERIRMYIKLKNVQRADEQLIRLEELAKQANSDSLKNDVLYTRANYYYTFGQHTQGDEAINQLINQYKSAQAYDKVNECYKTLIDIARKSGNAALVARTYEKFILWTDSVKALTARDEMAQLKQKYDDSLLTIKQREGALSTKQYIIIGLCILAAILAVVLVLGGVVLLRFILLTRKQKKAIAVANEHNELKTRFIQNISSQMEPTLNTLPATLPGVQALHTFAGHIQELSELEQSLTQPYEMEEKNINTFCESMAEKVRAEVKADVTVTVNAPKLSVKIAPEALEHVLLHLLDNAARYTPEGGKIWLDFKKRGAHTHQFVVSDTGCGISEEKRDKLFKPFSEVKDLTEGDGLGLPICSLMATKMNGTLSIDPTYTKGTRFVLELHV